MFRLLPVVSSFAILLASGRLSFAQADAPGELAKAVAPYVDAQTVAVAHFDLAAFDVMDAVGVLADFLHLDEAGRGRAQSLVVQANVLNNLPEGARADVCVVVSVSDFASLPFFFVTPVAENQISNVVAVELRRVLSADFKLDVVTEQIGAALVTGSPRTIERLKKAAPQARPEIAAAFQAAGASPFQVLLVPSADARRAIEALVPKMPAVLGGGPTKQFTQNMQWIAIAFELPPDETAVRVVVQSPSAEAATSLASLLNDMLKLLGQQAGGDGADFDKLTRRLSPEVSGVRFTLGLTAEKGDMAKLGSLLQPIVTPALAALGQIAR